MKKGRICEARCSDPAGVHLLPEDECNERLARLAKGLAHPARVAIIRMLENKPPEKRCICGDIVDALPLAQSSVSQHLKVLKETGWIQGEIDGPRICYCTVKGITAYYLALMKQTLRGDPWADGVAQGRAEMSTQDLGKSRIRERPEARGMTP